MVQRFLAGTTIAFLSPQECIPLSGYTPKTVSVNPTGDVFSIDNVVFTDPGVAFTENSGSMGSFSSSITGLNVSTTYYVRAYATTNAGTAYGEEVSFITRNGIPEVTTDTVAHVLGIYATCVATVTDDGGLDVIVRGICWSTEPSPTVSNCHTSNGSGLGSFTGRMTGLTLSTTYYVRAYASTSQAIVYGEEMSFTTLEVVGPEIINGAFTVNTSGAQVYFSQGNLLYQASTNIWKFAENQYDYVGSDNSNISSTYSGWIDLFGWGTSGYNHGAYCYQPWSTSTNPSGYYAYGSYTYNLNDQTGQADWGYNPISNGGNTANQWRTLTQSEWNYVFNTRTTTSGIRYAKANVNNVNGVILLPDDWSTSTYSLSSTNTSEASFSSNTLTTSQWSTLEQAGAVFLPAAGNRGGTSVNVGSSGRYWSASHNSGNTAAAYSVEFDDNSLGTSYGNRSRCNGYSVRLVLVAE